jgi:hypothetical protein
MHCPNSPAAAGAASCLSHVIVSCLVLTPGRALPLTLKDDERFSPDELDAMLRDLQQMQAFA